MFLWPMLENVIVCFSYPSLQNTHGYYMDPWETCSFLGVWSVLLERNYLFLVGIKSKFLRNFFSLSLTSRMFIWIVHMWARIWSIWFCHPLCNSASLKSHEALKKRHDSIQASLSFFFLFSFWNGGKDYDPVVVKGQKQMFFLRHLDNFICYSFQPQVASLLRCRSEGITAVHFSGKQEGFFCVWKSMLTKAEGTTLECQASLVQSIWKKMYSTRCHTLYLMHVWDLSTADEYRWAWVLRLSSVNLQNGLTKVSHGFEIWCVKHDLIHGSTKWRWTFGRDVCLQLLSWIHLRLSNL